MRNALFSMRMSFSERQPCIGINWHFYLLCVDCVPEAGEQAQKARSQIITGSALTWSGFGLSLGGLGAGLGYIFGMDSDKRLSRTVVGVSIMLGGVVVGLILELIGINLINNVQPRALDAMNIIIRIIVIMIIHAQ